MTNVDPEQTFKGMRLMTFEQLFDADLTAIIEQERQKEKAEQVPFVDHPALAAGIQKALDFSEIHASIEVLQKEINHA